MNQSLIHELTYENFPRQYMLQVTRPKKNSSTSSEVSQTVRLVSKL